MWNSTEPPIDPPEEMPATEDLRGNDVYVGDDVFYGEDGVFLADDISADAKEILTILGFEKGEYRNA